MNEDVDQKSSQQGSLRDMTTDCAIQKKKVITIPYLAFTSSQLQD